MLRFAEKGLSMRGRHIEIGRKSVYNAHIDKKLQKVGNRMFPFFYRIKRMTRVLLPFSLLLCLLLGGCGPKEDPPVVEPPQIAPQPSASPSLSPSPSPSAEPAPEETPTPTPEPTPQLFTLTFAGDCTLGTDHETYGGQGTLVYMVGDDYGYPFEHAKAYFENDDFTLVNLEGVFSDYNVPAEKTYRFRAPPAYAKILTAGSVEAVNLANNHSYDYGSTGYADTKAALESEGVTYVEEYGTALYTTESGLMIGLYAGQFTIDVPGMQSAIAQLRSQGAEVVICSFHWGVEGSYRPTSGQEYYAHAAIDAGADIVFGHHPHVLQPVEYYGDGVIYYSMGNFAFGGNRNPRDKDTAVIRQTVIREPDGSVHLDETQLIPFRLSSHSGYNDYKPMPYSTDDEAYTRTLSKLDGSYTGPDLVTSTSPSPEPEEEESPAPEETPPAEPTEPPATEAPETPGTPEGGETPDTPVSPEVPVSPEAPVSPPDPAPAPETPPADVPDSDA